MKRLLAAALLVLVAAGAGGWWWLRAPAAPEHRVFVGGQVLSMDEDNRVFEAASVRGKRVRRLGTTAEIMALVGPDTVVTELDGRTLLPGFIDAHGHFPGSGLFSVAADLASPPMGAVGTMAELQARLRARLDEAGADDDEWLAGFGYDDTLLAEGRHPNRDDLDAVSRDAPIYIFHVSMHIGVANSRALELLGIEAASADPEGGRIVRRPGSREPDGRLEEAAHIKVAQEVMDFGVIKGLRMALDASAEYIAHGVTTAQSGGVDAATAKGLAALVNRHIVKPRLVLYPYHDLLGADILAGDFDPADIASSRVIIGPVKILADGSIQGYTGYLTEPYHVAPSAHASPHPEGDGTQGGGDETQGGGGVHGDDEGYRGYPAMPREELAAIVERFHRADMQLAIHGNGDAAIDDILHALAAAQRQHPRQDPRLVVIHAQMARDDQLANMLELGATPSFFSAHTYYWGDRHRDIFMGPARAARMSPAASAERLGLRFSIHLDTPVTPMRPLLLLWSAINRQSTTGATLGPEQRIDPMTALRAITIDAAWQSFQDHSLGSLEPGKLADMVILDGDPLTIPDVRDLEVVETMIGGATVYRRSSQERTARGRKAGRR